MAIKEGEGERMGEAGIHTLRVLFVPVYVSFFHFEGAFVPNCLSQVFLVCKFFAISAIH
jgi:hypothetical protein